MTPHGTCERVCVVMQCLQAVCLLRVWRSIKSLERGTAHTNQAYVSFEVTAAREEGGMEGEKAVC